MTIYDISIPIREGMVVWPGDAPVQVTPSSRISEGAGSNVSILRLSTHAGTHVDPPRHFIDGGGTIDRLPLDALVGPCYVCEIADEMSISVGDLETAGIPDGIERILFKTRNSDLLRGPEFRTDFTFIEPGAADWLVRRGVRLGGIDYLSVAEYKHGHPTHVRLLEAGVVVLETIDLSEVEQGTYTLVCLPLRIQDGDGSPARAILMT